MLTSAQKRVISNIFRDLTKLTVVALVIGPLVPGQIFNWLTFMRGVAASMSMMVVALIFAVNDKEVEL